MLRLVYSLLFCLALPLVFLRVFWRARSEPRYRENLLHRLGLGLRVDADAIWVHAVSAGETIAARGLINRLVKAGYPVLLSNMTPAGRERAEALFGDLIDMGKLKICYAPYDVPFAVNSFFRRVKPRALFIIDTELWPNIIARANLANVDVFLVNGRLSEQSAAGYQRFSGLAAQMFQGLTVVFAQSESQASRFRALGSPNVVTTGSVKFDASLPEDLSARVESLKRFFGPRQLLLAASTHEGEEDIVLDAFSELAQAGTVLILAPRHIHRVSALENNLRARGLTSQRRSSGEEAAEGLQVFILDTMGELLYFYGVCSNAFVGGSLVDAGGHNPMEPAMLGKPMSMGAYRRNISDISEQFAQAGALVTVANAEELLRFWRMLASEPSKVQTMSAAALDVMNANRGALDRTLDVALPYLESDL